MQPRPRAARSLLAAPTSGALHRRRESRAATFSEEQTMRSAFHDARVRCFAACVAGVVLGSSMLACGAPPDPSGGPEGAAGASPSASTSVDHGAVESVAQSSEAITTCGGRAQQCCPGGVCYGGYACNSNNVCRTPCGAYQERCCGGAGGTCGFLLACYPDGTCGLR
jgi:hypothetical protein